MKPTPTQFFCSLMENQHFARYTDEKLLQLMEKFNQRKYRSGLKIIVQNRREYNRGALPGQEVRPLPVPKYDKHGNSCLSIIPPVLKPKKGKKK
jgi:hypothetical protein